MEWDLKEPECLTTARLMVAAPEFVYEQLKFYGKSVNQMEGKKELEKLLLTRGDRLINLALAQFATHTTIIADLYNRAKPGPAEPKDDYYSLGLRVACLSNRHFDYFNWPDFDLDALMARGLTPESAALLTNPSIRTTVLESLFKKSECFAQVDEQNWLWMIQTATKNERLNIDESGPDFPDLSLMGIQRAIFEFLETAPVSQHSAYAAIELLSALAPEHTVWPDEIAHVLDRWSNVELKSCKGEDEEGWSTHLTLREELRCLIAALYARKKPTIKSGARVFGSADDPDIALRCAFYAGADLSEKEIEAGLSGDNEVFVLAALKNRYILLNRNKRALIEAKISGRFIYEYQRRCEQIAQSNKYFDASPVSETARELLEEEPSSKRKETSLLDKITAQNERLLVRLTSYERKVYWIVFILIGAMYFISKR